MDYKIMVHLNCAKEVRKPKCLEITTANEKSKKYFYFLMFFNFTVTKKKSKKASYKYFAKMSWVGYFDVASLKENKKQSQIQFSLNLECNI